MKKKIGIGIGIVIVIAILITVAINKNAGPEVVQVTKLKKERMNEKIVLSGTLNVKNRQNIYRKMELGEIKDILVEEGQDIKVGDPLIEYESPVTDSEIEQAKLQVKTVKIQLDNLYKKKKEAQKEANSGESEMERTAAKATVEDYKQQIQLAEIEKEQSDKQLALARDKKSDLVIKSKIAGKVIQIAEDLEQSQSQEPVIVIVDPKNMVIESSVSEYQVMDVKVDQSAVIKSDAIADKSWRAVVTKVGELPLQNPMEQAQGGGGQVKYPLTLRLEDEVILKIGSKLIVEVVTDTEEGLTLPRSAVKKAGDKDIVYVVQSGKAVQKEVKMGKQDNQNVMITSGIDKEEKVIQNPSTTLTNGAEVKVQ
ncbi:efflux RND transporter periplasmic adaptor subunit [Hazenella sp. IB182353]|uniref:efflux RND transporter periplasmic adaptor subunit n=1 Tax=Polycladospora coralii TaxID=2771432 RepID=UPI001746F3C9|nr:efflux RND transporter periplasmic adaptor subunit [Polycladospora coralii]MBS7530554.1 efflux RND transporter periplasmic adaptor subunit [Polycladospora coralii]